MKLRYKFIIREVGGSNVAVAVGKDNELFNGMIKLNETGSVIFNMINQRSASQAEIVNALIEKYGIREDQAKSAALTFLDVLRQNELLEE